MEYIAIIIMAIIMFAMDRQNGRLIKQNQSLIRRNHSLNIRYTNLCDSASKTEAKHDAVKKLLIDQNEIINNLTIKNNADKSIK